MQIQFQRKKRKESKNCFNGFTFSIPMGEDLPFPLPSRPIFHHLACHYDLESFFHFLHDWPSLFLSLFSLFSQLSLLSVSIYLNVMLDHQHLTLPHLPFLFQKSKLLPHFSLFISLLLNSYMYMWVSKIHKWGIYIYIKYNTLLQWSTTI